ncbi:MAG: hypothetical protein ABIV51_09075 [Saprospiraceae bacterium]
MTKHVEYEKMPKNLKNLWLSEQSTQALSKMKWAVTEKVQEANFSFIYQNRKLLFAKWKEYLEWNEDFFGFQGVVAKFEENVRQLFEQLGREIRADNYHFR